MPPVTEIEKEEKQAVEPIELVVEAKAELTTNNFPDFAKYVRDAISKYDYLLETDEDFTNAAKDVVMLKETETSLKEVQTKILEGNADVKSLTDDLAELSQEVASLRLKREKEIKTNDALKKESIVKAAVAKVDTLSNQTFRFQFEEAIKGKRGGKTKGKFQAMEEACDKLVKTINERIQDYRKIIDGYAAEHGKSLFSDRANLEIKTSKEVLTAELDKRVAESVAQKATWEAEQELAKERAKGHLTSVSTKSGNAFDRRPKEQATTLPPTPAPQQSIAQSSKPSVEGAMSEKQEFDRFIQVLITAFAPAKEARQAFIHPKNIKKGEEFAKVLGDAWEKLNQ